MRLSQAAPIRTVNVTAGLSAAPHVVLLDAKALPVATPTAAGGEPTISSKSKISLSSNSSSGTVGGNLGDESFQLLRRGMQVGKVIDSVVDAAAGELQRPLASSAHSLSESTFAALSPKEVLQGAKIDNAAGHRSAFEAWSAPRGSTRVQLSEVTIAALTPARTHDSPNVVIGSSGGASGFKPWRPSQSDIARHGTTQVAAPSPLVTAAPSRQVSEEQGWIKPSRADNAELAADQTRLSDALTPDLLRWGRKRARSGGARPPAARSTPDTAGQAGIESPNIPRNAIKASSRVAQSLLQASPEAKRMFATKRLDELHSDLAQRLKKAAPYKGRYGLAKNPQGLDAEVYIIEELEIPGIHKVKHASPVPPTDPQATFTADSFAFLDTLYGVLNPGYPTDIWRYAKRRVQTRVQSRTRAIQPKPEAQSHIDVSNTTHADQTLCSPILTLD